MGHVVLASVVSGLLRSIAFVPFTLRHVCCVFVNRAILLCVGIHARAPRATVGCPRDISALVVSAVPSCFNPIGVEWSDVRGGHGVQFPAMKMVPCFDRWAGTRREQQQRQQRQQRQQQQSLRYRVYGLKQV